MTATGVTLGEETAQHTVQEPVAPQTDLVPASDFRSRVLAWSTWLAMTLTSSVVVLGEGRNVPVWEDWKMVPAMTGHEPHFWQWMWKLNNEHRVPVPKLIYLGLLKLWPDFRVGMIFNLVVMAAIAAGFIVTLHRVRGRTRWTDAFFPVAFLHLGHWENLGWSWQIQFVVATALVSVILMALAMQGEWTTGRAWVVGVCLVAIPFTGATGLPFAPLVAAAILLQLRQVQPPARWVLAASGSLAIALSAGYFIGWHRAGWAPPSPLLESLATAAKFLALGVGPAAGAWWLLSTGAVGAVIVAALAVLYRSRRENGLTILAFLGGAIALAAELGNSRASSVRYWGLPDRYALIALPGLCAAYIAFERHDASWLRRVGPGLLCAGFVALIPLNTAFGFQYEAWYHTRVDAFADAIRGGTPIQQLRKDFFITTAITEPEMRSSMQYLKEKGIGAFRDLQLAPMTPSKTTVVDGLDSADDGWITTPRAGTTSTAAILGSGGGRSLQWSYGVGDGGPAVLGRIFPTPEDWRGQGAIALTVSGQNSGHQIRIRLAVSAKPTSVDRYDSWFTDDFTGTRTITLPWSQFHHVDLKGTFNWKRVMPLDHMAGVVFVVADPGPGILTIERVAVVAGYGDTTRPIGSAGFRRSIGPWH